MGAEPASPRSGTVLWQRGVAATLVGAQSGFQILSRSAALRLGVTLGDIGYRVAKRQRRRAERNLYLAYGDALTPAERDLRVRQVFRHFGKCLADFLRGPALRPSDLDHLIAYTGWEQVERARAAGRGVILLTAHLGNWELLGRWVAARGVPLTVVAREPEAPAMATYLRRMREGAGFAVLNKGESARTLLRVLRRGEAIILLPDQNSGDLFLPFFGVPAGTVAGPASLALHTGADLIPCYCVREPDDRYRILTLPALSVVPTGDHEADVARIMTEANRVLEGVIRDYPDQWLWLHNRWKSAFEEKNRPRWPAGFDFETARARWR